MRPENSTANATTAIDPPANHGFFAHSVPSGMKMAPTAARTRKALSRARGVPPKSANTRIANDPKAPKSDIWALPMTCWVNANTAGMQIAARVAVFRPRSPGSALRSRDTSPRSQFIG